MILGLGNKSSINDGAPVKEFAPLCDLDTIVDKDHKFRFDGKWRKIKPITTKVFFEWVNGLVEFQKTQYQTPTELNAQYFLLMQKVTDDLSLPEIAKMEMVQKYVLLNHIAELITGTKASPEAQDLKKKIAKTA